MITIFFLNLFRVVRTLQTNAQWTIIQILNLAVRFLLFIIIILI